MIFPWQAEQWRQLWQAKCEQRLPHALLFSGIPGTGKAQFADGFTRALLCQPLTIYSRCAATIIIIVVPVMPVV